MVQLDQLSFEFVFIIIFISLFNIISSGEAYLYYTQSVEIVNAIQMSYCCRIYSLLADTPLNIHGVLLKKIFRSGEGKGMKGEKNWENKKKKWKKKERKENHGLNCPHTYRSRTFRSPYPSPTVTLNLQCEQF